MDKLTKTKGLLERAKEERQPHEQEIRDAFLLTRPARDFDRKYDQSPKRQIYNASLRRGARNLVTNVMRLLIPQNRPFAEVKLKTDRLQKQIGTQLAPYLQDANDRFFRHILGSNFYLAITEAMYDAVIAGTGCIMIVDEDTDDIGYLAVPTGDLYFLQDYDGSVDTVFREHQLTCRQLESRFGFVPESLKDCKHPKKRHKILEAVIPSADGKYDYTVYLMESWEVIEEHESPFNPFIVFRWEKDLDSVWGEGPVRAALSHGKAINQMSHDTLQYGEYAAKGLWQVLDETMNVQHLKGQLKPGDVIAVSEPLQPVPFPGQFLINFELLKWQEDSIKQMMHDNTLPSEDALKYMTAQAVLEQRAQFLQQIGEPAQRLTRECLQPIADQVVARLQLRGDLVVASPEEIQALGIPGIKDQKDMFRIEVNAAIHRAIQIQEASDESNAVATVSQLLVAMPPEIRMHLDTDKFVRSQLSAYGVNAKNFRTEQEVEQIKQQQAQQQAMQQAMALAEQGADIQSKAQQGNPQQENEPRRT